MKTYFIKNDEGMLVQVKSPVVGEKYLNASGEEITCEAEIAAPHITTGLKAMEELTGLVRDLVVNQSKVNERVDVITAQIRAAQEVQARGFVIGGPVHKASVGTDGGEDMSIFHPYDMAVQGKRLMDKMTHPGYQLTEEKRMEMAKYFILLFKAGAMMDNRARDELRRRYGEIDPVTKTAIGDVGNVFPTPDIVDIEILAFAREISAILQNARIWDMTSDKQSFPLEGALSASVGWGNTTAAGDPTVSEMELSVDELSAYATVKNSTLADARSDIVSWLTECLGEAAGLEIDNASFNGDGTSTYGYCSGILSAACGYSVVMGTGSSAFSMISAENLSEMIAKLDGLRKMGAKFWMHGSILHFLRTLKDSQNRPVFVDTWGSVVPGQILGYPYQEVIKAPSTTGASTAFVVFGNLRYFGVGRRLNATALSIDPYGLFLTNRTRFKIYQRWALKMAIAKGFVRLITAS